LRDIEALPYNHIEELHKRIGRNVQRIRKAKKISQLKLSLAMGYNSVSVISCAEIYHRNIHFNIEHLAKIAYILDVPICDFFTNEEPTDTVKSEAK
jgi:transcriptional regulator with XRE-family HTH domain